jgi:hypothetical protein
VIPNAAPFLGPLDAREDDFLECCPSIKRVIPNEHQNRMDSDLSQAFTIGESPFIYLT